jgi:uncharacterized membrane protein YbhN (UPF0104 family)
VAAAAIYLVLPKLIAVPGAWPRLSVLPILALLSERDTVGAVLDRNWRQAILLTAGRLGFDYMCLLTALRAPRGADPRPSLVLLAYSAAGIVALFPVTPGGLGVVEASPSGSVDPGV